jgi:transposase
MKTSQKIIKIAFGIDISSEDFVVSRGIFYDNMEREVNNIKKFKNNQRGFNKLLAYARKLQIKINPDGSIQTWYVMEASGVYYENLAYFLTEKGLNVHVALANKVKNFIKTSQVKSKTDDLDSRAISLYGLEKQLNKWVAPAPEMKRLKELCRELSSVKEMLVSLKNQLHAKRSAHEINSSSIKRTNEQIKFFNKQIKTIEKDIDMTLKENPEFKARIDKIEKINGVGTRTILIILSETNKFEGITNRNQLTSFVGLDIVENQSGKKTGKTRISKKGNSHIRKALYMPAMSCKKHNLKMKNLYERVCERHGWKIKKIGIIAVMRKILHLIYALWKNDTEYDPNYGIA